MRIQLSQHPPDCPLDQFLVVRLLDVIALDVMENLGQEVEVLVKIRRAGFLFFGKNNGRQGEGDQEGDDESLQGHGMMDSCHGRRKKYSPILPFWNAPSRRLLRCPPMTS